MGEKTVVGQGRRAAPGAFPSRRWLRDCRRCLAAQRGEEQKKLIRNITEQSRIELGRLSRWNDTKKKKQKKTTKKPHDNSVLPGCSWSLWQSKICKG